MARTCAHPNCNESLEGQRPNKKYCSEKHKNEAFQLGRQRQPTLGGMGASINPHQNGFNSFPQAASGNEFLLQQRIMELTKEKQDLAMDLKEAQKKKESLKDELAALKQDHAIFKVQNEKEEGGVLNGIMAGISENPSMLPELIKSIPAIMQGLSQMGPKAGGQVAGMIQSEDPEVQAQLGEFIGWYSNLSPDIRAQLWAVIEKVSNMEPENQKFHLSNFINNLPENGTAKTGTN